MSIQVKFFASLREKLGMESTSIDARTGITIRQIWEQVLPGVRVLVNLKESSFPLT